MNQVFAAPWSKEIKIGTYAWIGFVAVTCAVFTWTALLLLRRSDPGGWGLVISGIVLLVVFAGVFLWSPRAYRIANSAVFVSRPIGEVEIPFSQIHHLEIIDSHDVFRGTFTIMGSSGVYGTFGSFTGGPLGSFEAYVTNDEPLVLICRSSGDPVVISPEDPQEFVKLLCESAGVPLQDHKGPEQAMAGGVHQHCTLEKVLLAIAIALILCSFAAVIYFLSRMPAMVPIHFGAPGSPHGWQSKYTLLVLPGISLLLFGMFVGTAHAISKRCVHKSAARVLHLSRVFLYSTLCFPVAMIAYGTWATGFTYLSKSHELGHGMLLFVAGLVVFEPFFMVAVAVHKPREETDN